MNAPQHTLIPGSLAYALAMSGGILIGAIAWHRRHRGRPEMLVIYIGALVGAFAGAKLAYLFAEGWLDWPRVDRWLRIATGKSVLGGLLGGYAGVELAKKLVGHKTSTGDCFALIVPLGLALGRVGCFFHGCCVGKSGYAGVFATREGRWPAPMIEGAFQLTMLVLMFELRRRGLLRDRLIFLYFAAYGLFRFLHEFMRETPEMAWGISGYQIIALVLAGIGAWKIRPGRAGAG
ncbi:MAG: prolipoprotein diacylglyceryl transferase [Verrucomicrobiaceae bacterium]|nr:prolipoprotein diacylglyceryl transferase [Verrucomicrobiaceae bacterium]